MTRSQAQRIQEIIRSQDVRNPRETLDAIKAVLEEVPSIVPSVEQVRDMIAVFAKNTEVEIPHLVPDDPKNEFGDPVAVLRIYNSPSSPGELKVGVAFDCCDEHIQPRHILGAILTLKQFADKKHKETGE
jgi:hypothetical protein